MSVSKWEYKTVVLGFESYTAGLFDKFKPDILDKELNSLGAEGWELIGTTFSSPNSKKTEWIAVVFKRQM